MISDNDLGNSIAGYEIRSFYVLYRWRVLYLISYITGENSINFENSKIFFCVVIVSATLTMVDDSIPT